MSFYTTLRNAVFVEKMRLFGLKKGRSYSDFKLWQRELIFAENNPDCAPSKYVILWEDITNLDAPLQMTTPTPVWIGMALHGGILPPVEVYLALAADEAKPFFKRHWRADLQHKAPPLSPMSEEEAIAYLIKKDLPLSVWRDYRGQRRIVRAVRVDTLPSDTAYIDAWVLKQTADDSCPVEIDPIISEKIDIENKIQAEMDRIERKAFADLRSRAENSLMKKYKGPKNVTS